ncbi:unnamed protein product, partial [Prorocentrum cordatum]
GQTAANQEKGCDKCSDNLLMCNKPQCWRDAVNITYQEEATDADDRYFEWMRLATQDLGCNSLVETSAGPVDMLARINSSLASGTVSSACRAWNCRVALTAFRGVAECGSLCSAVNATDVPLMEAFCGLHATGRGALGRFGGRGEERVEGIRCPDTL